MSSIATSLAQERKLIIGSEGIMSIDHKKSVKNSNNIDSDSIYSCKSARGESSAPLLQRLEVLKLIRVF